MTSEAGRLASEKATENDAEKISADSAVDAWSAQRSSDLHLQGNSERLEVSCEAHNQCLVGTLSETEAKKQLFQEGFVKDNAGNRDTWWAFYYGRYGAFFEQTDSVTPKHVYLDRNMKNLFDDEEEDMIQADLHALDTGNRNVAFPGPLVRSELDHRAVYRYILTEWQRCINDDSLKDKIGVEMVWRTLAVMWRKNGMVSGKDLAIQLLWQLNEKRGIHSDIVDLLILDKREEALNLAIKNGSWEHALILDSFFRKALCIPTMARFINGLDDTDPMKTYYQVCLGEIPEVAHKLVDMSWREWCPHLAIILANCFIPKNKAAIINMLAENFAKKGHVWSAHFCYMAICTEPGYYHPDSKLILIGQDFSMPLKTFACDAAIKRTEIYEYLLSLSQGIQCPRFQVIKVLYAWRLFRAGCLDEAFRYAEAVATNLLANSLGSCPALSRLLDLCDALSRKLPKWIEPPWMTPLKRLGVKPDPEDLNEDPKQLGSNPPGTETETGTEVSALDGRKEVLKEDVGNEKVTEPSGDSIPDPFNEPQLPCERPKKKIPGMKKFWTRLFCWCGKPQD